MRCPWSTQNELLIRYHDEEWGVPVHEDRKLFEFLVLDAFQAGLSWSTILKKRENFREAFEGFDVRAVARFSNSRVEQLLKDESIIRNRLKVVSTISNARLFLAVQDEFGSFDAFIWRFVEVRTIQNSWMSPQEVPVTTSVSERMSTALRDRGFKFVGPTICYAFMQAAGLVNDHLVTCFRHGELGGSR